MFSKNKSIIKSRTLELSNVIEGTDIYNAKFIYMLRKLPEAGVEKVNVRYNRVDLLSKSIYGDSQYSDILLLYNGVTIDQLDPEFMLRFPLLDDVNSLLTKLTTLINHKQFKSANQ